MHRLCECASISEGDAVGLSHNNVSYLVVNHDNRHYVYINRCPHLGIALNWQPNDFMDAEGEFIRCSTHGALFEPATGQCVSGPCAGDALTPVSFALKDGTICI